MSMFNRNEKDAGVGAADRSQVNTPAPISPPRKPGTASAQPVTASTARTGGGTSVISKALKITGQLESTEDIRIDGEVDGDVHGIAVTVGSGAKVKGSVYGQTVELAGKIEGKIEAKKVVLTSTAHMLGDVIHQEIKIESGAYIDGYCRPGTNKAETKPEVGKRVG